MDAPTNSSQAETKLRHVGVMGLVGDNGRDHILVVVCLNPIDAYSNRNGSHMGHIRQGKLVLVKGATVSEGESDMILRTYQALRVALDAIHGN